MLSAIDDDQPQWEHDVFVSFRGEEVRGTFLSHLFREFDREGIEYYRDDDQREIGLKIAPKLLHAIHHSKVSIVLFSSRYAESKWCLNELVEILEFHEKHRYHGHRFMPVFFQVRAGELREQTGAFGKFFEQAIVECIDDLLAGKLDPMLIMKWKTALREAGNMSGWRLNTNKGSEAELVENIVKHLVCNILHKSSPYLPYQVVPVDSQVEKLISVLTECPEDDVCMVGIHGEQGIGKTTLAGLVFEQIRQKFQGFSFLQLDDKTSKQNLIRLQRKLLFDVLKVKHLQMDDPRSNANEIKKRLHGKKLLLVLDNISDKDQAKHFGVGEGKWLSSGSKILITTRHQHLLSDLHVDREYEVEKLGQKESLQLFCRLVFESDEPNEGYEELSSSLVSYADGSPAAIENLASDLSKLDIDLWHKKLEMLKKTPRYLDLISSANNPFQSSSLNSGHSDNKAGDGAGQMPYILRTFQDFVTNVQTESTSMIALISFTGKGEAPLDVSHLTWNGTKQGPVIEPAPPPTNDAKGRIEVPTKTQTQLLQEVGETRDQPSWEAISKPLGDSLPQSPKNAEETMELPARTSLEEVKESGDRTSAELMQLVKTMAVDEASSDASHYPSNLMNKDSLIDFLPDIVKETEEETKTIRDPYLEEIILRRTMASNEAPQDVLHLPQDGIRKDSVTDSIVRSAGDAESTIKEKKEAYVAVLTEKRTVTDAGEKLEALKVVDASSCEQITQFRTMVADEALEDVPHFSPINTKKIELLRLTETHEAPLDVAASTRNEIKKEASIVSISESTANIKHMPKAEVPNDAKFPLSQETEQSGDRCPFEGTSVLHGSYSHSMVNDKVNQKFQYTEEVERLVTSFTETSTINRNALFEIVCIVDKILQGIPENFAELQDFDTLSDLLKSLYVSSLPSEITLVCGRISSRLQVYKKLFPETNATMLQLQSTLAEELKRISETTLLGISQEQSMKMWKDRLANLEARDQEITRQIKLLQEESRQIKEDWESISENMSSMAGMIKETAIKRSALEETYNSDSKEFFELQNLFAESKWSLVELKLIIEKAKLFLQS